MTNPAHLLLTGLVLLVAFLGGAIVGSILKSTALALTRPRAEPRREVQRKRSAPPRLQRKTADDIDATVLAAMEKAVASPATVELSVEEVLASAAGDTAPAAPKERIEPDIVQSMAPVASEPSVAELVAAAEPQAMGEQDFAEAMLALTKPAPSVESAIIPPVESTAVVVAAEPVPEVLADVDVAAPKEDAVTEEALVAEQVPPAEELPAAAAPLVAPAVAAVAVPPTAPTMAPARVAGRSVFGRDIPDPRRGAPPRPAPRPVLRVAAPSAQVIPFPVHVPVQQVAPPAMLGDVKAELEALLLQPTVLEATTFSPLPELTISPRLQAARAELELVSAIPVAPPRPPVVLTTESFGASAAKPAVAEVQPEPRETEPGNNLPLGLEATLAEAIGATMELAPNLPEPPPQPRQGKAAENPVALAAFDIVADVPQPAEGIEDIDIVPEFELVGFDLTQPKPEPAESVVAAEPARKDVVPVVLDPGTVPMVLDPEAPAEQPAEDRATGALVPLELDLPVATHVVDLDQMRAALADDLFVPNALDAAPVEVDANPFVAGMEQALMGISPEPAVARNSGDEAAAMQAIEGGWSPRRASPRLVRSAELPDGGDASAALAASGAAVAAASRTASAIVSELAPDPARPAALDGPREGNADDLTHIIGVLPVIETALNKLGVYHYDQIAAWSAETVAWVENHLGLDGRIQRELWRLQARELAAARPTLRKVRN